MRFSRNFGELFCRSTNYFLIFYRYKRKALLWTFKEYKVHRCCTWFFRIYELHFFFLFFRIDLCSCRQITWTNYDATQLAVWYLTTISIQFEASYIFYFVYPSFLGDRPLGLFLLFYLGWLSSLDCQIFDIKLYFIEPLQTDLWELWYVPLSKHFWFPSILLVSTESKGGATNAACRKK